MTGRGVGGTECLVRRDPGGEWLWLVRPCCAAHLAERDGYVAVIAVRDELWLTDGKLYLGSQAGIMTVLATDQLSRLA